MTIVTFTGTISTNKRQFYRWGAKESTLLFEFSNGNKWPILFGKSNMFLFYVSTIELCVCSFLFGVDCFEVIYTTFTVELFNNNNLFKRYNNSLGGIGYRIKSSLKMMYMVNERTS